MHVVDQGVAVLVDVLEVLISVAVQAEVFLQEMVEVDLLVLQEVEAEVSEAEDVKENRNTILSSVNSVDKWLV